MTNQDEILAIVVSYNPDRNLIKSIESIVSQNVDVILIDNASVDKNILNEINNQPNIKIVVNKSNIGLAAAQNIGLQHAIKNKYKYASFFDQDSILPEDFFFSMCYAIRNIPLEYIKKWGIIGPNFIDRNTKEYARFAILNKKSFITFSFTNNQENFKAVSFIISSGSIIKVSLVEEIGLFRSKYFIDQVDTEFCMRTVTKGYFVIATNHACLNHTIGERQRKKLLFLTIRPNYHSKLRKFFIFRNGIHVMKEYGENHKGFSNLMFKRLVHDTLAVIFFEPQKFEKIRAIIVGIIKGLKGDFTL